MGYGGIRYRLQLYSTTDMKKSFALGRSAVKKKIAESEKIRKADATLYARSVFDWKSHARRGRVRSLLDHRAFADSTRHDVPGILLL